MRLGNFEVLARCNRNEREGGELADYQWGHCKQLSQIVIRELLSVKLARRLRIVSAIRRQHASSAVTRSETSLEYYASSVLSSKIDNCRLVGLIGRDQFLGRAWLSPISATIRPTAIIANPALLLEVITVEKATFSARDIAKVMAAPEMVTLSPDVHDPNTGLREGHAIYLLSLQRRRQ